MNATYITTPADLLTLLRSSGFTVRLDAGKLLVSPASRLTDDERAALREHREGMLALLGPSGELAAAVGAANGPKARGPISFLL